jgi:hypothetical protein
MINILGAILLTFNTAASGTTPLTPAVADPQARLREISFSHPVDDRVELISAGADVKLIRFKPTLSTDALTRYLRDGVEPVQQIELAVRATGTIESFRVSRSDGTEVFKVAIENSQLKFVRQKDENLSFPASAPSALPFAAQFKFVIELLTKRSSDEVNVSNAKVLKALRIFSDPVLETAPVPSPTPAQSLAPAANPPAQAASAEKLDERSQFLNLIDTDVQKTGASSDQPKL